MSAKLKREKHTVDRKINFRIYNLKKKHCLCVFHPDGRLRNVKRYFSIVHENRELQNDRVRQFREETTKEMPRDRKRKSFPREP